jgi:sugar/nucleoside kinase (ribokinase family)
MRVENSRSLTFLCIGSATQDVFLSQSRELDPVCKNPDECFFNIPLGDKINVNKIHFTTGGGASNAATTFARGGAGTLFMGTIGHDPAGAAVLHDFDRENIDTTFISYSDKYNTDYSTLLLAPNGERTILTYRGCGDHLRAEDFDLKKVFDQNKINWIYITSLAAHWQIYDEIFREAKKAGVKIAWNPGKLELANPEKLRALLADVEIFSVNKQEAQRVVSGENLDELLRHLRNYVPVALVTDGTNGFIAGDKTSVAYVTEMYDKAPALDATGAGDAFASGFTLFYARGEKLRNSVHFAAANAASVVHKVGAKTGILTENAELKPMKIDVRASNY